MTSAVSAPQGATDEEKPTGQRRRISRLPLWVRLSAVTALVLLGVLLASTLWLGASGPADRSPGGDHGSGGEMQMDSGSGGQHGSDDSGSGGDHGSGGGDHGSGGGGHGSDD